MIRVLEAGLFTTVQDLGRDGYYHLGIPPSGVADRYSFILGNLLLGNPPEYAGLETTLLGVRLEFQKKTVIAITGAPSEVLLNGKSQPMWETIEVNEGDVLSFGSTKTAVHSYLCISGGIQVPDIMGSKSTYTMSQLGGFEGRKLRAGDLIEIGNPLPGASKRIHKRIPSDYLPVFENEIEVRAVLGLASYILSDDGVRSFLNKEWKVSNESSRVAYRFHGPTLQYEPFEAPFGAGSGFTNVVDTAYPLGGILVTNSKEIIIMMTDATTGGGFMTMGTVISPDLDRMAQSRPNTLARFSAVTVNDAYQVRLENKRKLAAIAELFK